MPYFINSVHIFHILVSQKLESILQSVECPCLIGSFFFFLVVYKIKVCLCIAGILDLMKYICIRY